MYARLLYQLSTGEEYSMPAFFSRCGEYVSLLQYNIAGVGECRPAFFIFIFIDEYSMPAFLNRYR
jgi:hypothetical protein